MISIRPLLWFAGAVASVHLISFIVQSLLP